MTINIQPKITFGFSSTSGRGAHKLNNSNANKYLYANSNTAARKAA